MADAEVIALNPPLGTRGRPGRGSGTAQPSRSARALAPGAKKQAAPKQQPPDTKPTDTKSTAPKQKPTATKRLSPARRPKAAPQEAPPAASLAPVDQEVGDQEVGADDKLAALLAFLRRRLSGGYHVDDFGFDQELTEKYVLSVLRPLAEKWFRVEVRGAENIPATGGALIVSNHSGTIPIDAGVVMSTVHTASGRFLRALGADLVFKLPVVSSLARKTGATLACTEDAERMLRGGELVGVWPEGFKGIGKPYSERYRLQRFGRGGFVSAALRTGVPIIPVSVVGAEEIYPLVGNVPALAKLLGVPYLPITPLFPWLGPLGLVPLPSKWLIEFGEPIRTDTFAVAQADDPMLVFDLTDQVRETIQQTLYRLLADRPHAFG